MVGQKAMQILNDFVPMPLMAHTAPPRLPSWDDLFRGFVNDEDNLRTQIWERNLQDLRLFRGIEAASRYQVMMMESTSPFEAEEYRQRYLLERYHLEMYDAELLQARREARYQAWVEFYEAQQTQRPQPLQLMVGPHSPASPASRSGPRPPPDPLSQQSRPRQWSSPGV